MFIPPSRRRAAGHGKCDRDTRRAIAIPVAAAAVAGVMAASLRSPRHSGGDTAGLVVFCLIAAALAVALGWVVARLVGRGGKI